MISDTSMRDPSLSSGLTRPNFYKLEIQVRSTVQTRTVYCLGSFNRAIVQ